MFPASLATGPFSLRAGQDSMAVSIGAVLQSDGSLAPDVIVSAALVNPSQRMTYIDADEALAAGSDADLAALAEVRDGVIHMSRRLRISRAAAVPLNPIQWSLGWRNGDVNVHCSSSTDYKR